MRMRLLAAAVLVASVAVPAGSAAQVVAPGGSFVDDDGNVHEGMIEAIAAAGVTLGCDTGLYCPANTVTRGQMASFLARAFDLPAAAGDHFSDDDGSAHEENINRIFEAGITAGLADGSYGPGGLVTRAQMGSFLARAMGLAPVSGDRFDDVSGVHEPNINAIAEAGVTLGCNAEGTLYCPGDPVRRDQMASFIGRALGLEPVDVPPRGSAPLLCGGVGSAWPPDVEVDLDGTGPVDASLRESAGVVSLRVTSGSEALVEHYSLAPDRLSASLAVADVTGDGHDDVVACVSYFPNDLFVSMVVVTADGGEVRVVLDIPSGLANGALYGAPGWVIARETQVWFAGDCVLDADVVYLWDGSVFRATSSSLGVVVNDTPACDPLIDAQAGNGAPSPGYWMAFTERVAAEGETLLLDGPDGGLMWLCAGPEGQCAARSTDADGEIVAYAWYVNGTWVGSESPYYHPIADYRDGLNTVTLSIRDDAGAVATVTGYVDRVRP